MIWIKNTKQNTTGISIRAALSRFLVDYLLHFEIFLLISFKGEALYICTVFTQSTLREPMDWAFLI